MPGSLLIDAERGGWREGGDDRTPCQIAFSSVELRLDPPGEALELAALRTHGRRRKRIPLPCNDRAQPVEIGKVDIRDAVACPALPADSRLPYIFLHLHSVF